jgi:acyl-CoA thioesterase
MPVDPDLCTPAGRLFGGAALGACLLALERFTERSPAWATAQYLAYAEVDQVLDIDVRVAAAGRRITQARAVGHVGDREILTVNAALGDHPAELEGQWAGKPDVGGPTEARPLSFAWPGQVTLGRFETRVAAGRDVAELDGTPGDGRSALWVRLPPDDQEAEVSVATLAVLGDGLSFGISQLLGRPVEGRSLDNTLRICHRVATGWVLADSYVFSVHRGLAHGAVHLWAEDGTLLATTSQSCVIRPLSQLGEDPL